MLKAHYKNDQKSEYQGYSNKSNSRWTPKETHHTVKTYIQAVKNDIASHSHESDHSKNIQNLTPGEKKALASLKEGDEIIISKAHKGRAVVIQDVETLQKPRDN